MPPKANKKAKGKQTETPSAAPVVIEKPPAKSPKNGAAADFSDSDDEAAQGATPQGDLTEAIIVNPNEAATPAPVPAGTLVPVSSGKKRKENETDLDRATAKVAKLRKKLKAKKKNKEGAVNDTNTQQIKFEQASTKFDQACEELENVTEGNEKLTKTRTKVIAFVDAVQPSLTPEQARKLAKFFKTLSDKINARNARADKLDEEISELKAELISALDEKLQLEKAELGID